MRVPLTGAAGFIGSTIADLLRARGDDVVPVDLLLPKAHGSLRPEWSPDDLIVGDIRDPELARSAVPGAGLVDGRLRRRPVRVRTARRRQAGAAAAR